MNTLNKLMISFFTLSSALILVSCAQLHPSERLTTVTTLSGNGTPGFVDGRGTDAELNRPHGIGFLPDGSLAVADRGNHKVRIVDTGGVVRTVAGGDNAGFSNGREVDALFNEPIALVADRFGNIYVADRNNHRIRRITPDGNVTTLAGSGDAGFADGPVATAKFNRPLDVALAHDGKLLVSEENNHRIRVITP